MHLRGGRKSGIMKERGRRVWGVGASGVGVEVVAYMTNLSRRKVFLFLCGDLRLGTPLTPGETALKEE